MIEHTVLFEDRHGVTVWHYISQSEARLAIMAQANNKAVYRAALLPREAYKVCCELGSSDDYLFTKFKTNLLNPN